MAKVPRSCACIKNGCECTDVGWFSAGVAPDRWMCQDCIQGKCPRGPDDDDED